MKCVEEPIAGEYKYKGVIVDVRLDKARLVNGKVVNREVVEHPGGVGILPMDSEGNCTVSCESMDEAGMYIFVISTATESEPDYSYFYTACFAD